MPFPHYRTSTPRGLHLMWGGTSPHGIEMKYVHPGLIITASLLQTYPNEKTDYIIIIIASTPHPPAIDFHCALPETVLWQSVYVCVGVHLCLCSQWSGQAVECQFVHMWVNGSHAATLSYFSVLVSPHYERREEICTERAGVVLCTHTLARAQDYD